MKKCLLPVRWCTVLELLNTEKVSVNYVEADKGVRRRQHRKMMSGTRLLVICIWLRQG